MAAMTDIWAGQYWVLEGNRIAVVVEKPDTGDSLEVNHVCSQGIQSKGVVAMSTEFRTMLRPDQARKKAMELVQAAVLRHLQFS